MVSFVLHYFHINKQRELNELFMCPKIFLPACNFQIFREFNVNKVKILQSSTSRTITIALP